MNAISTAYPAMASYADEIARVACFLLSEESSYMTGALVAADGGYTAG